MAQRVIENQEQKERDKSLDQAKETLERFWRNKRWRQEHWDPFAFSSAKYWYGDQWKTVDKQMLYNRKQAPAVFNQVLTALDLLLGGYIQNAVDNVAKPFDEYADVEIAHIITSGLKHVEQANDVSDKRRWTVLDGYITGVGVEPIGYENINPLEGMITIGQESSFLYYLDPDFQNYDLSDAKTLHKESWISHKEVEQYYGKKIANLVPKPTDDGLKPYTVERVRTTWDSNVRDYGNLDGVSNQASGFASGQYMDYGYDDKRNKIRVVEEYLMVREEKDAFFNSETGKVTLLDDIEDETDREFVEGLSFKTKTQHIRLITIVGDKVVAQDVDTEATEFKHLFNFFFPYFHNGVYFGIVENLKYPQDEINKSHSRIMHILGTLGNPKLLYEDGAFMPETEANIDENWSTPGKAMKLADGGLSKYKIEKGSDVPQTLKEFMYGGKKLIQDISHTPDAIEGRAQRQESGRAKITQINQATIGTLPIIENWRTTQKNEGRAIIYWMQKKWTAEKYFRVIGADGNTELIGINIPHIDKIANDITVGKFDIYLDVEGKTQSERERTRLMMIEASKATPGYEDIFARQIIKLSDFSGKDEILAEINQRNQLLAQQAQQAQQQGQQQPQQRRGAVQSAPRPNRGVKRQTVAAGG